MPAFLSGLLFAAGLGLSGMTRPDIVQGFFDVFGTWNPQLALVMAGAVGVNLLAFPRILKRDVPFWGDLFHVPTRKDIDKKLIGGAALFGLGWGAVGLCPGPALVSLGGGATVLFVFAMVVGMWAHKRFVEGALT